MEASLWEEWFIDQWMAVTGIDLMYLLTIRNLLKGEKDLPEFRVCWLLYHGLVRHAKQAEMKSVANQTLEEDTITPPSIMGKKESAIEMRPGTEQKTLHGAKGSWRFLNCQPDRIRVSMKQFWLFMSNLQPDLLRDCCLILSGRGRNDLGYGRSPCATALWNSTQKEARGTLNHRSYIFGSCLLRP